MPGYGTYPAGVYAEPPPSDSPFKGTNLGHSFPVRALHGLTSALAGIDKWLGSLP